MSYESFRRINTVDLSPDSDLIEIFNKKTGLVGVINPNQLSSPPSGVSGAIQFSDGSAFASDASNLFWDNPNKRLGVGTNSPTKILSIGATGKTGEIGLNRASDGALVGTLTGDNGGLKLSSGAILFMGNNGFNTISTSGVNLGAMWGIRGSGSTSATTSLLVQNSAGTELLKITDNGLVLLRNDNTGSSVNSPISFSNSGGNTCTITGSDSNDSLWFRTNSTERMRLTAGGCGINTGANNVASAQLQIDSTTKGFLPPRQNLAQRTAIASPAVGLMVYQTDAVEGLYVYKSTGWTFVI